MGSSEILFNITIKNTAIVMWTFQMTIILSNSITDINSRLCIIIEMRNITIQTMIIIANETLIIFTNKTAMIFYSNKSVIADKIFGLSPNTLFGYICEAIAGDTPIFSLHLFW